MKTLITLIVVLILSVLTTLGFLVHTEYETARQHATDEATCLAQYVNQGFERSQLLPRNGKCYIIK